MNFPFYEKNMALFSPAAKLGFFLTNLALEDPQQVFADYVPMNPIYQESEWCQAGTIEHFEKMAGFHGNRHQNMKNWKSMISQEVDDGF